VARPSTVTGADYEQLATAFFQNVNHVVTDAESGNVVQIQQVATGIVHAQSKDQIATAPRLKRRLLCAGWLLCFLRPRVLERNRPVESEALRRTLFVQDKVAEALKLIPGFASRLPQDWLASSRNDFE